MVLLAGAVVGLEAERHQLVLGFVLLAHPSYPYLDGAVMVEVASVLALARVQWLFLQSAHLHAHTGHGDGRTHRRPQRHHHVDARRGGLVHHQETRQHD